MVCCKATILFGKSSSGRAAKIQHHKTQMSIFVHLCPSLSYFLILFNSFTYFFTQIRYTITLNTFDEKSIIHQQGNISFAVNKAGSVIEWSVSIIYRCQSIFFDQSKFSAFQIAIVHYISFKVSQIQFYKKYQIQIQILPKP